MQTAKDYDAAEINSDRRYAFLRRKIPIYIANIHIEHYRETDADTRLKNWYFLGARDINSLPSEFLVAENHRPRKNVTLRFDGIAIIIFDTESIKQ